MWETVRFTCLNPGQLCSCWCAARYLSDPRVFLCHQFVHVAVKDDVDVALQADPHVVQFIC